MLGKTFIILACLCTFNLITANNSSIVLNAHLNKLQDKFNEFTQKGVFYLSWPFNNINSLNVSQSCQKQLNFLHKEWVQGETWAHLMINSNAGSMPGIVSARLYFSGDFEQCTQIKYQNEDGIFQDNQGQENGLIPEQVINITGKNIFVRLAQVFSFGEYSVIKSAICLPSSCDNNDVFNLFEPTIKKYEFNLVGVTEGYTLSSFSHKANLVKQQFPWAYYIIVTYLSFFLLVNLFDILRLSKNSFLVQSFSLRKNYKELVSPPKEVYYTSMFETSRIFFTTMVIFFHSFGHTFFAGGVSYLSGVFSIFHHLEDPYKQGFFSNTFFSLLMILASSAISIKMYKLSKHAITVFDLVKEVLFRCIKFWPSIIFLICIEMWLPRVYNGPAVLDGSQQLARFCEKNYWGNLLFIHNLMNIDESCLVHTWTISCEMQLLLFSCVLTYIYSKSEYWGLRTNILFIIAGHLKNCWDMFYFGYSPFFIPRPFFLQTIVEFANRFHFHTFAYFSSYFIIYLAIRHAHQSDKLLFTSKIRAFICVFLVAQLIISLNLGSVIHVLNWEQTPLLKISIFSIYTNTCAFLFAWIICLAFPIIRNKKLAEDVDIFNKSILLVVKNLIVKITPNNFPFIPIMLKLIRPIYFVHHAVIVFKVYTLHMPNSFIPTDMVINFPTIFILTVFFATLFHLFFDAPFLKISDKITNHFRSVSKVGREITEDHEKIN